MNFLKRTGLVALAACALLAAPLAASTPVLAAEYYYGGWYYDNNVGGWEKLSLGNSAEGSYLHVEGDGGRCGPKGASYQTMRTILSNDGDEVNWSIQGYCGELVRICVENRYGQSACSAYWFDEWNYSKYPD